MNSWQEIAERRALECDLPKREFQYAIRRMIDAGVLIVADSYGDVADRC